MPPCLCAMQCQPHLLASSAIHWMIFLDARSSFSLLVHLQSFALPAMCGSSGSDLCLPVTSPPYLLVLFVHRMAAAFQPHALVTLCWRGTFPWSPLPQRNGFPSTLRPHSTLFSACSWESLTTHQRKRNRGGSLSFPLLLHALSLSFLRRHHVQSCPVLAVLPWFQAYSPT